MQTKDFQKMYENFKKEQSGNFHFDIIANLVSVSKVQNNTVYLQPEDEFSRDNFKARYLLLLQEKLIQKTENQLLQIELQSPPKISAPKVAEVEHTQQEFRLSSLPPRSVDDVNPEMNFQNYIQGEHNEVAIAIAKAIIKGNRTKYNPYFIYANVGLGKTHLLHAIGNACKIKHIKVLYTSSESFFNSFIHATRNNKQKYFKEKYRNVDILLMDDIHSLSDKTKSQEELFYIFNQFQDEGKQLIFSCDCEPNQLKGFTDRLKSRFKRGCCVSIEVPSYEVRRAIIEAQVHKQSIKITPDLVDLLAKNVNDSIRDIYGAMDKILAYQELMGRIMNVEMASRELKEYFSQRRKPLTAFTIQQIVADHYDLSLTDLLGKKRNSTVVLPRQIAVYLCRELTSLSTIEVGKVFRRDHSTVITSTQKILDLCQKDIEFNRELEELKAKIQSSV